MNQPDLYDDEVIKDIQGYEELYAITSHGRVWSYPKRSCGKYTGQWLKPRFDKFGYIRFLLYKNFKPYSKSLHRLIAQSFISNPMNKPHINHIDSNPSNNHIDNLEWCTHSENIQHSYLQGHRNNRPVIQLDLNNNIIAEYTSFTKAEEYTGIYARNISQVCKEKRHTAGGYKWRCV